MARVKATPTMYNADDVWAAAALAQRINGGYDKVGTETKPSNRLLMLQALEQTIPVTEADREVGAKVRKYYQAKTFKVLQGVKLSDFDNSAMVLANRDGLGGNFDLAVVCSLPSCYERSVKRDQIDNRLGQATGGFIGAVGDKVCRTVEVIKCNYSMQWNCHFVSVLTTDDEPAFFSLKSQAEIGTVMMIQGTVKAHRDNITQLNRVKVIK
jgi:hypothetical protein